MFVPIYVLVNACPAEGVRQVQAVSQILLPRMRAVLPRRDDRVVSAYDD